MPESDINLFDVVRELARLSDRQREEIDRLNLRFNQLARQLNKCLKLVLEMKKELKNQADNQPEDPDDWWKNGNGSN